MDPLARRYMWNVITALGASKSVVVTTHRYPLLRSFLTSRTFSPLYSMEECDALATRIGIMSQGELVCLGTSQHLKSRYASGYSLQLKAKPQYLDQVKAYISKVFPLAHVSDEHGGIPLITPFLTLLFALFFFFK
jgi:ABC-type multidrug transport system ATPase subunit